MDHDPEMVFLVVLQLDEVVAAPKTAELPDTALDGLFRQVPVVIDGDVVPLGVLSRHVVQGVGAVADDLLELAAREGDAASLAGAHTHALQNTLGEPLTQGLVVALALADGGAKGHHTTVVNEHACLQSEVAVFGHGQAIDISQFCQRLYRDYFVVIAVLDFWSSRRLAITCSRMIYSRIAIRILKIIERHQGCAKIQGVCTPVLTIPEHKLMVRRTNHLSSIVQSHSNQRSVCACLFSGSFCHLNPLIGVNRIDKDFLASFGQLLDRIRLAVNKRDERVPSETANVKTDRSLA